MTGCCFRDLTGTPDWSIKQPFSAICQVNPSKLVTTMRLFLTLVAALVRYSAAFAPYPALSSFSRAKTSLAVGAEAVPISVTGNNFEVTPALNEYVVKKLERTVSKLASSGAIKDCEVHLVVNKNPKVRKKGEWRICNLAYCVASG